jgi:hypothetical protein
MSQSELKTDSKGPNYIYSTLSSDQRYTRWGKAPKGGLPTSEAFVFISGKANIATKNFVTPKGVLTIVNDEQMKILVENNSFKTHKENGFITVERKKAESVDEVAADMTKKDLSAQLVNEDFKKPPKTSAPPV